MILDGPRPPARAVFVWAVPPPENWGPDRQIPYHPTVFLAHGRAERTSIMRNADAICMEFKEGQSLPLTPLKSEFAGDPDMVELLEMFLTELPQRIAAIDDAARAGRLSDLQRLAHQLKGASAGYGFPSIGEAAAKVEAGLKLPQPSPELTLAAVERSITELLTLCRRANVAA